MYVCYVLCIYVCFFFIHSSMDRHLDWFHVLAIVNNAAVNKGLHIYLFKLVFLFGYIPKSGVAASYVNSIFNILSNLHTDFQSVCTNLYSHQQPHFLHIYANTCHLLSIW